MTTLTKRATVYLDQTIHKAVKIKAMESELSVSEVINEALRHQLAEDEHDLDMFAKRAKEPSVSYEKVLKQLRADGKI